jgi:hypothetical protein
MKLQYLIAPILLTLSHAVSADLSAIWTHEWAIDSDGHSQKFETTVEPEFNYSFSDNLDMTIIGRLRLDSQNNLGPRDDKPDNYSTINGPLVSGAHGELSIREWYFDSEVGDASARLGKQQVVWGQADGLKILDVVNPQSYREFILDDFDDSRIPLWMANVVLPIGDDNSLQFIWVPDLTYHEFAEEDTAYALTSPLFVPQLPEGVALSSFNKTKPSSVIGDSDVGLKFAMFQNGWDLTFNYLYHYQDTPVLYQNIDVSGIAINSVYERNNLMGATASNVFGDFILRTEIGYSTHTFHVSKDLSQQGIHESSDLSSVIGVDWQGLDDTMISIQWFQSHLFEYDDAVVRPQNNNIASLLYKRTFENEAWTLNMLALHGFDQTDGSIQSSLSYMLESNINVWVGSDIFYGKKEGLFGQFNNQDRITMGFEWGF